MRRNKLLNGIIAVIMAGVLAAGVCCLGFASRGIDGKWFGNFKNISTWHWSDKSDDTNTGDNTVGDNTELSVSNNKNVRLMSARIAPEDYSEYGISPQSQDAYTLTATVKDGSGAAPDYLQSVTFSVGWASSSSLDITKYITLNQSGMTATFSILQSFNTQIVITCTSTITPSVSATATVDYIKRFFGYYPENSIFDDGDYWPLREGGTIVCSYNIGTPSQYTLATVDDITFVGQIQFGGGTINNNVSSVSYSVRPTDEFKNKLSSYGFGNSGSFYRTTDNMTVDTYGYATPDFPLISLEDILNAITLSSCFVSTSLRYDMYRALSSMNTPQLRTTVTVNCRTGEFVYYVDLKVTASAPGASSIEFDNPSFII